MFIELRENLFLAQDNYNCGIFQGILKTGYLFSYFDADQIRPSPYITLSADTLEGKLEFTHIPLSTIIFGIFQLYLRYLD